MKRAIGPEVRLPETNCLDCGRVLDCANSIGGKSKPSPGDITVCLMCGHLMAFNKDLTMRPLTDAEIIAIAGDEQMITIQAARGKIGLGRKKS